MVLTGVALGAFASTWFLVIAAFFGAGLTFAGATGTCWLALLLMKAPWNRPAAASADAISPTFGAGDQGVVCVASAVPRR